MKLLILTCLLAISMINADSNADLVNTRVERTIDLTTHLVHINNIITVENKATSGGLKSYTFTVEPIHAKSVAYIGAQLPANKAATDDLEKRRLNVVLINQDSAKGSLYRVDFKFDLTPGKTLTFEVELTLINQLKPYPTEITQTERQNVLFKGNHYYYSLYTTKQQTTTVNLASDKVESYSQLKPTTKSESLLTYGPYENVKPFEQNELSVHYENNSPFLVVKNLVRTIELSHWGNIAVEETLDLYHYGALLKGPFSRFDYMRRIGGAASVKSFKTLLPPSASDVYYRDEIGNISTSNLRTPSKMSKSLEPLDFELRPRFPLFGGWRTHYTIGYNLPIYQYLFNKGNDYVLKMRLLDHIYDDQFIENAVIRIILPEHTSDIKFVEPYTVEKRPQLLHYTYLDVTGRPVIEVRKTNAVDSHIQDFQLSYKFNKAMIIIEPLLVVGFFLALFLVVILVVRIDFSISSKPVEHVKKE